MPGVVFVDSFSALDDLPVKSRRDRLAILAALEKAGRFSAFEVDRHLAPTVTAILASDWIARTWGEYPWTYVELSDAGREALWGANI
jgi:hypothetical protein